MPRNKTFSKAQQHKADTLMKRDEFIIIERIKNDRIIKDPKNIFFRSAYAGEINSIGLIKDGLKLAEKVGYLKNHWYIKLGRFLRLI